MSGCLSSYGPFFIHIGFHGATSALISTEGALSNAFRLYYIFPKPDVWKFVVEKRGADNHQGSDVLAYDERNV